MKKEKQLKLFGLIGRNIDYSFSRKYFSEKFRKNNLNNCIYRNYDLKEGVDTRFGNLVWRVWRRRDPRLGGSKEDDRRDRSSEVDRVSPFSPF